MINWEAYRQLFPVTKECTYFMTAGAGAIPTPVLEAITDGYQQVALKGGAAFFKNIQIMETCREKLAKMINADKENIAFIPSVSYGMNILAHSFQSNGPLLMPELEFPSTFLPWKNANKTIYHVSGEQDLETNIITTLKNKAPTFSALVTSLVNYMNGYRLNVDSLMNHLDHTRLIVNATQGIGVFPLDVKKQPISAMIASCYKWMCCGEGVAFMYISPDFFKKLTPVFVGWRSMQNSLGFGTEQTYFEDARIFELGWDNMISFAGFNTALDLMNEIGIDNITNRVVGLSSYLIESLNRHNIPMMTERHAAHLSGIVLIGPFKEPAKIEKALAKDNIFVNSRKNGIRISLHFYNNKHDIEKLVRSLTALYENNH